MNITAISYTPYPSGFNYNLNPKSKSDNTVPDNSNPFAENNPAFQPVVNTNPLEPISQSSETGTSAGENNGSNPESTETKPNGSTPQAIEQQLTPAEMRLLDELQLIDTQVRQHEMAHVAAGGRYITSGANFTYKRGPDGQNYAVGGEVSIDTAPVPGDPKATIQKMQQVKRAALAPADPSSQDIRVASKATQAAAKALSDLMIQQASDQAERNENKAFGDIKKAANAYETIGSLPEDTPSSFQIAV